MQADWNDSSVSQDRPRITSKEQKLEGTKKNYPLEVLEKAWP